LNGNQPMPSFDIPSERAMLALGRAWAGHLKRGAVVFLAGDLGAGKTTLARGVLRGLGHAGAVTSPTYTLAECYAPGGRAVYHFDLYRLQSAAELETAGLRDALDGESLVLIEWPERGGDAMPAPDLRVDIRYAERDGARRVHVDGEWPGPAMTVAGDGDGVGVGDGDGDGDGEIIATEESARA